MGGADTAPPRAWQAASSSPCASHASGDAHGTVALLTLLRRVAIGAGVLGVLGALRALKAHAATLLALLATQVHSAGAWGVAGYVAAFAAWGVLCLPLSPFELLSGLPMPALGRTLALALPSPSRSNPSPSSLPRLPLSLLDRAGRLRARQGGRRRPLLPRRPHRRRGCRAPS